MIYLFFSVFSVSYFYFLESSYKLVGKGSFFIFSLPFLFFYFLFPALQYGVGTDYFNYLEMYQRPSDVIYYDRKLEFIFSYILRFVNEVDLGGQFIFVAYSILFSLLFYIFLNNLNKNRIKVWLFLFVFFICSGIYQNQMNGIRQYSAIYALMISIFYVVTDKKLKAGGYFILGQLMHSSFILNISFLLIKFIKVTPKRCVFAFIISFVFFGFFVSFFVPYVLGAVLPQYLHYLDSELMKGWSVLSLIPKLYYFPFIVIFLFIYSKEYKKGHVDTIILKFSFLACCLYWCFLSYSSVGMMTRVGSYWVVFNCFPIYYVLNSILSVNKIYVFFISLLYLIFPFVLKVIFFPSNEYVYNSILG
ncbi:MULTISPECIES: EpsG family protein [Vibrio]|uniref:EpsG family protein n=1 Tax=Vibrio TaxID=662 RepID=UPI000B5C79E7|nr:MULTISPECIES: EpsG family protein [Vibrio]HBV76726.1 EpsG family protein [Vibrio sp.]